MNSTALDLTGRIAHAGEQERVSAGSKPFVLVPQGSGRATALRRALSFAGPGYLVAVGYMDPGNWATSLSAGSKFGYALLAVALISNIMAIILQALCARL